MRYGTAPMRRPHDRISRRANSRQWRQKAPLSGAQGIGEGTMAAEAYCTKCRTKREIQDEREVTLANGRHALQGTCPVCATKLLRFVAGPTKAASMG